MYFKNTPIDSMKDAYNVAGKNVVVTGGNRGIGRGVAEAFAQCGANVAIVCRNEEGGKKACEELAQYGGKYRCFPADVSDRERGQGVQGYPGVVRHGRRSCEQRRRRFDNTVLQ